MNECTLPTYREAALCRHIDVHQSQHWSWIHQPTDEQALSPTGRMRLSWIRWHVDHGSTKSLTCRHFAIGRPTLDRWLQRYQRAGLRGLEDRSRRPHRVTPPTWTTAALLAVAALREQYPYMGKAKLRVLLLREGHQFSVSMVGRMLTRLRCSGQLHEPMRLRRRRGRSAHRPHAIRKPKDYVITAPGDLVQIDTLDVAVAHGSRFLQLSLVDVCCRWTAAEIRRGKAALTMRASLQRMEDRLPFALRAIQIDGGSEFKADFEAYCQERGIMLFVLPPRSPKLNGMVERLQRSYRDEFYACVDLEPRLEPLSQALRTFEDTYNTIRPHQALGYQTPQQFLDCRDAA